MGSKVLNGPVPPKLRPQAVLYGESLVNVHRDVGIELETVKHCKENASLGRIRYVQLSSENFLHDPLSASFSLLYDLLRAKWPTRAASGWRLQSDTDPTLPLAAR